MGWYIDNATVRLVRIVDEDLAELAKPYRVARVYCDPCALPSRRWTLTDYRGKSWTEPWWRVVTALDHPETAILQTPQRDVLAALESAVQWERARAAQARAAAEFRRANL